VARSLRSHGRSHPRCGWNTPRPEGSEAVGYALREDPHRGKPLQLTLKGLYSWRTGDWRIVYRIDRRRLEVVHATPGHRYEVYDHLRDLLR
jgi:hypothetical protein